MTDDDDTPRERHMTSSERSSDLVEQRLAKLEEGHEAGRALQEQQRLDIASLLASRRSWRWAAGLGVPVLLTSIVVVMLWAVDHGTISAERSGETKATIDSLQFRLNLLESYVHELQRHAGLDSKPMTFVQGALPVGQCDSRCTTSGDCDDFFSSCRYCSGGRCSATLPADPRIDAGADAPGGTAATHDTIASEPSKGPHHDLVSNP